MKFQHSAPHFEHVNCFIQLISGRNCPQMCNKTSPEFILYIVHASIKANFDYASCHLIWFRNNVFQLLLPNPPSEDGKQNCTFKFKTNIYLAHHTDNSKETTHVENYVN